MRHWTFYRIKEMNEKAAFGILNNVKKGKINTTLITDILIKDMFGSMSNRLKGKYNHGQMAMD